VVQPAPSPARLNADLPMPSRSSKPRPAGARARASHPVEHALAALARSDLNDAAVAAHVAPLFSRHRQAFAGRIYLASHSLGRPLDATADDVAEGLAHWYAAMGDAWGPWEAEMRAYRARLAALLGVPRADSVVPKTSAAQGLRAVLNSHDGSPRVVATRGEFDSLDLVLREYARRGRIELKLVEPRDGGLFDTADLLAAVRAGCDLVVVSEVMFQTGQRLAGLPELIVAAHAEGARVLVDVYHSLGVLPQEHAATGVDFVVGGSYKYLRGGPGACFLYVHPRHLDAGLRTLDTGWFAKEAPFGYARPDPPAFAAGGDGWLESTPPVLPFYQARAGQIFVQSVGVARLREHSLARQRELVDRLAAQRIPAVGGTEDRGAFVVVRDPRAAALAEAANARGVACDARGEWLRLCPDVLSTGAELAAAAGCLAEVLRG
jgi:kynureninase